MIKIVVYDIFLNLPPLILEIFIILNFVGVSKSLITVDSTAEDF